MCSFSIASDYRMWYLRDSNNCRVGYSDADWAGCVDDRKSTSGRCFYLEKNLVSWMNKKQNSVSLSTAEAEYIAASSCCAQLLWMKKLLHDNGISQDTMCIFFLTIQVPLIYPRTLFNIQIQSISKFDIISFAIWWKRKLYGLSSSTPTIKRLIFSLNHLMVLGLNLFVRPQCWYHPWTHFSSVTHI